jgi:membrane protein implicated in regulation of membrane protease activity
MGSLGNARQKPHRRWWIWMLVGLVVLAAGAHYWFLLLYGGALKIYEWSAPTVSLPPLHVRVVDGATGAPIQGARVFRRFYRQSNLQGLDGSSPGGVPGSLLERITDQEGRVILPGTESIHRRGIKALTGMSWVVFKSGWMPASGCYTEESMRPGDCSGFGGMGFEDRWFRPTVDRRENQLDFEMRLLALPKVGAQTRMFDRAGRVTSNLPELHDALGKSIPWDPSGEYFARLRVLVQRSYVSQDELINEAVSYVGTHALSDSMMHNIGILVPSEPCDSPNCRDPRIRELARAIVEYCDKTPESAYCKPRQAHMITKLREWLGHGDPVE